MAFDERGQADSFERRIAVCQRAYDLLVQKVGVPRRTLFSIRTSSRSDGHGGTRELAVDFIRATKWIKENLPQAKVSAASATSASAFAATTRARGDAQRVLYHAIKPGSTWASSRRHAGRLRGGAEDLLALVEDVLLTAGRRHRAAHQIAESVKQGQDRGRRGRMAQRHD